MNGFLNVRSTFTVIIRFVLDKRKGRLKGDEVIPRLAGERVRRAERGEHSAREEGRPQPCLHHNPHVNGEEDVSSRAEALRLMVRAAPPRRPRSCAALLLRAAAAARRLALHGGAVHRARCTKQTRELLRRQAIRGVVDLSQRRDGFCKASCV